MANPDILSMPVSHSEAKKFITGLFSKDNLILVPAFVGGLGLAGFMAAGVESPDQAQPALTQRIDSGVVTNKTQDWGGSTTYKDTVQIFGFPIHTSETTVVDNPDYVLTIKNCDNGPEMCVSGDLYVSGDIFKATEVGDGVNFLGDNTVSAQDFDSAA